MPVPGDVEEALEASAGRAWRPSWLEGMRSSGPYGPRLGSAAVDAGHRVRYYSAAELSDTLYRGLVDNSVGKIIDGLLRHDLVILDELGFAPLDDTGAQPLFRF